MKLDAVTVIKCHTKTMISNDEKYMKLALAEAKKAYAMGEVPVGAVIVKDGHVIAKSHNKRQTTKNVFGHAEVLAIGKATKKLNAWILDDCTIYVTLEPCLMCAGAIIQARMKRVCYGASEPKFGALGSLTDISALPNLNHHLEVVPHILEEESSTLIKNFFRDLRKKDSCLVDKSE